jgi:hypothetical protein
MDNSNVECLGKLTSVGGDLDVGLSPLSKKYSVKQLESMVNAKNFYHG